MADFRLDHHNRDRIKSLFYTSKMQEFKFSAFFFLKTLAYVENPYYLCRSKNKTIIFSYGK